LKRTLLVILIALGSYWGYNKLNGNFSISNITLKNWPQIANAPVNSPAEIAAAQKILDQPFHYLSRGRQSFVFESADQKYVLKFVKCQRINVTDWYEKMPLPRFLDKKRKATLYERTDRITRMFTSFALAKDPLQDATGVLLLHITPERVIQRNVQVIDKLGFSHTVDLTKVPFALQVKAAKIMPTLKALYKKRDKKALEARLDQIIALFVERAKLGIANPDSSLLEHNNIGFTDTRAIYIDIGTFKRSKHSMQSLKRDFKVLKPLVRWLKSKDKALAESFSNKINAAINQI